MYELKKNGKVFTSKFVGTGPSSIEKRIYPAAVSQRLRNTAIDHAKSARRITERVDQVISSSQLFWYGPFVTGHVKLLYKMNTSLMTIGITRFWWL